VFVGNINAPCQIVIAGSNVGMDRPLEEARRELECPSYYKCQPADILSYRLLSSVALSAVALLFSVAYKEQVW
jgi:hypothetical protein